MESQLMQKKFGFLWSMINKKSFYLYSIKKHLWEIPFFFFLAGLGFELRALHL
jgi:hypothetical protein